MDFPATASATRQASARQLVEHLAEVGEGLPLVVGGDLNTTPDSDEVRLLTGRTAPARPGFVLRDAWDAAEPGDAGHTWSADNPWAAPLLLPSRRIDYLFTSPPGRHGVGHVTSARVHRSPVDGVVPSDHHPVVATLRY
jgi:endonuclease/exonuclease/phosphatase family metal-dependent hydrolase